MQHCDGLNFTTRGQIHIDGHVIPWLLTGHVSFYLEDGQKVHRRMRFPLFTFLIQVCTSFCHLIWTTSKIDNTEYIKYPETNSNAVGPNEKATQVARKSYAGPPTQDQPQHSSSSSLEAHMKKLFAGPPTLEQPQRSTSSAHGAFPLRNVTPVVLGRPPSPQITHKRNPGPNGWPLQPSGVNSKPRHVPEDDVSEGSIGHHARFAAPHSSEGDVAKSDLERRLSISLAAQTERDQRIAQLTDELALKSALLEQAEANAADSAKRAGLELREHADRLLMQSSRAKGDVELRDMQTEPLSRDQQIEQCEKELANVRVNLEAKESELEAVRLRLAEAEEGWAKSKVEADTLRAQTAAGKDDDQVIRRLIERVRDIEVKMASMRWNEKSIEAMECRNEG